MKYLLLSTIIISGIPNTVFASSVDDQKIDPSNLTNVTTSASVVLGSEGKKKGQATMSGASDDGVAYQGKIEASFDGDNDYTSSRGQWFQAYSLDYDWMPKGGFSIDINNQQSEGMELTTGALGAISMLPTPVKGLAIFPQLAAVAGEIKLDAIDGEESHTVYGGMGALYISKKLGERGSYLMLWPEYTHVSGDSLTMQSQKFSLALGMPISSDKAWWTQILLEHSTTHLKQSNMNIDSESSDKTAWFFFRRYF